jgi:hypothetical protein
MEYKVRLPGASNPVSINTPKAIQVSELLELLTKEFNLQDPKERIVVIPPTTDDSGKPLNSNQIVAERNDQEVVNWRLLAKN